MMDNGGFTIDGIPAKELNIIMGHDSDRPMAPSTIDRRLSIAGRNGSLDFGSDVGDRYFNLVCNVVTRNFITLQEAVERITSVLLDGYGRPRTIKLVFDVNPDRYFLVKYSGSLSPNRLFGYGKFVLPLITTGESFARSLMSSDNIDWDSEVTWDSDITWNDAWAYRVTGNGTIDINNWGTMITKPIIEIDGSFTTLTISCNGKTFNYNSLISNGNLLIDCKKMKVKLNGNNALKHIQGDFIELLAGSNEVTISGTAMSFDIEFKYEASYF